MCDIKKIGYEPGDTCNRNGCSGTLDTDQDDCQCSTCGSPPCSACENSWVKCSDCDFDSSEGEEENDHAGTDTVEANVSLSLNIGFLERQFKDFGVQVFNETIEHKVRHVVSNMFSRDWAGDGAFNTAIKLTMEKKFAEKYPDTCDKAVNEMKGKILSFEFPKGSKYHQDNIIAAVEKMVDEKIDRKITEAVNKAMLDIEGKAAEILAAKLLNK